MSKLLKVPFLVILVLLNANLLRAQTQAFTYQGSLKTGGVPANGVYDFRVTFFDVGTGGASLGSTDVSNVQVTGGIFTIELPAPLSVFGSGDLRYIEIAVRPAGGTVAYETLTPRQLITSAPYAVRSLRTNSAESADVANTASNSLQLGGVAANQFVLTGDGRLSDARQPLPNSPNYIQNSSSQQSAANFNVSGNGTVGGTLRGQFVNSSFGYQLGGQAFLGAVGTNSAFGLETGAANLGSRNTFAGYRAGSSVNSNAVDNSFFGANAGRSNTGGLSNSFFGAGAGELNTVGGFNAFFGYVSGAANLSGNRNAFFGVTSGRDNTTGSDNTFVGSAAGQRNTTGELNTFVGANAGVFNETGTQNSFFGYDSGRANTTGGFNSFFGASAGANNTTGLNNSFFGYQAGAVNTVGGFNAFFGFASGNLNSNGNRNAFFGVTAGRDNTSGSDNSFFGGGSGQTNQTGEENAFFGSFAGSLNTTGSFNSFFGRGAGQSNVSGTFNTALGYGANFSTGNLSFATAIGAGAVVSQSNTLVLGRTQDTVQVPGTLSGSGANLTNLNAANITTGALDPARLNNGAILNGTMPQASSSFNISGNGTAGGTLTGSVVAAATQFNLRGERFLFADGFGNIFVGRLAGESATTASAGNSFFGESAGRNNTAGFQNSFFGQSAGAGNSTGFYNSFFGYLAGTGNTTGESNSFFGRGTGQNNSTGSNNSFFGYLAGLINSTGGRNSFFGERAGSSNSTGSLNSMFGWRADMISGLTNATAIGAQAYVLQSNSLVLGSINGVNGATADTNVGIGTTTPLARLHVSDSGNTGLRVQTGAAGGTVASFGGNGAFQVDAPGVLGGRFTILENGNVGIGTATPADRLTVAGMINVSTLGAAGLTTLCRNGSNQISTCSSSLRYKENVQNFAPGLDLIRRLRPVSFDWKSNKESDFGLVAEEVAAVEPLLTTRNEKGEIEGVKYDRLGVVLVNAVGEQQAQIEAQAETIRRQQAEIEQLKAALCALAPAAKICAPPK